MWHGNFSCDFRLILSIAWHTVWARLVTRMAFYIKENPSSQCFTFTQNINAILESQDQGNIYILFIRSALIYSHIPWIILKKQDLLICSPLRCWFNSTQIDELFLHYWWWLFKINTQKKTQTNKHTVIYTYKYANKYTYKFTYE